MSDPLKESKFSVCKHPVHSRACRYDGKKTVQFCLKCQAERVVEGFKILWKPSVFNKPKVTTNEIQQ